jgi:NAD(P)-dependent dehydrogenase (short-subunit alcohol dehydrogenase family)
MQFGVNHVAHFLLTSLLLDKMKAQSSRSRVVAVSSSAHAIPGFDLKVGAGACWACMLW